MTKELWINLPVKNVKKSAEFFDKIGFTIKTDSPGHSNTSIPMSIGAKAVIVMLFEEGAFQGAL
jgi:predicted lactoylglutathione lyase